MKTMRMAALLLAVLLLGSCGAGTPAETNPAVQHPEAEPAAAETETKSPLEKLTGLDFGGQDFRIVYVGLLDEKYDKYIACEEATGDLLNDTSLERTNKVEELLNVSCSFHPLDSGDTAIVGRINNTVASGEDAYDYLQFASAWDNCTLAIKSGSLLNLYDVPHLNLDAEYYYPVSNGAMTINNKLYFGFSSYNNAGGAPLHLVFNKNLMTDLGLEVPYDTILEGDWTFDRFLNMIKDASADLDGNGKMTIKDRWGYLNNALTNYLCFGFNISVVERNENGSYKPALRDESVIDAFQKIVELRTSNPDAFNTDNLSIKNAHAFMVGNVLFSTTGTGALNLRSIEEFDFGIAPFPKRDENQKEYANYQTLDQLGIPVTEQNPDVAGAGAEALAIYSSEMMTPAYIETYLQNKLLRDEESVSILRMMMQSIIADVTRYYDFADGAITPVYLLGKMKDPGAVVSVIAEVENSAAVKAEEFFAIFFDD